MIDRSLDLQFLYGSPAYPDGMQTSRREPTLFRCPFGRWEQQSQGRRHPPCTDRVRIFGYTARRGTYAPSDGRGVMIYGRANCPSVCYIAVRYEIFAQRNMRYRPPSGGRYRDLYAAETAADDFAGVQDDDERLRVDLPDRAAQTDALDPSANRYERRF